MAIDLNDEILQDFLVEAGEIIELLGEQLVELEQSPEDPELLNAIFRGFHTVKGGAGFLAIQPLVDICHKAEDVFNVLRQGDRRVSSDLMDVILQVVDVVTEMFDQVRAGNDPEPAEETLLAQLHQFNNPEQSPSVEEKSEPESGHIVAPSVVTDAVEQEFETMLNVSVDADSEANSETDEITEQEFEDLLDSLHGKDGSPTPQNKGKSVQKTPASDDITEEEFDHLLDELHGKGQFSAKNITSTDNKAEPETGARAEDKTNPDDITEEEFEQVLDSLHGKGKFNAANLNVADEQKDKQPPELTVENKKTPKPEVKKQKAASGPPKVNAREKKPQLKNKISAKPPASQSQGETTVRVDTHVLDEIMNMVGELVLVRNRFQTLKANEEAGEAFSKAVANLDVVTADLQLSVMKTRMQPIKKVFGRFPRIVRDLSRSLKKEIRLEMVGEDTDLDKNLVEALADPLVHLIRNAVDHGIELPDDRVAAGKPREGVVVLTASQEGDHILLSIEDDGKGMNANALRAKVIEKALMDEDTASRLDDKECFNLIFMPGFSTKSEISDVSGRGVGMDVVKTRISQMNGVVAVDSTEGKGSTIIIKVPLTLAIMPTLMVKLAGQPFALPLASVVEILDLDLRKTNVVDGQLVIMVRERALPLFYLSEWLVQDPSYSINKQTTAHIVVVNAGGRQIGFVVDQLIGQEEVVIKPLGAQLQGLEGLAGATITGDGKIALILDVPGLMTKYAT